jgi:hypothetical protein
MKIHELFIQMGGFMKVNHKSLYVRVALIGLCSVTILLGLTSGGVLAVEVSEEDYKLLQEYKKKLAEKQLPPHEMPSKSEADYKSSQAYKKKLAEKQLPPHEAPHKAEPPTGGHANLAAAATNPISNLVQVQVQNAYSPSNHNSNGYSNVSTLQAVVPFKLPWDKVPLLITRSTLPYVTTPNFDGSVGRQRGFGDAEILLLATPKLKTKGVQIGLGMNTAFPTAGDNNFTGNGKWQAGPAALYINMQTPKLQWGLFGYQLWDVASSAGNSDRPDVSKLSIQPILTKHFDKGWYVASSDTPQTYDWETKKWDLALGAQVGRVQKLGKAPVKWFTEVLYNPVDDNGATSEWSFKANLTFLFPK